MEQTCKICDKECKNFRSLGKHISLIHNIRSEKYYWLYINDNNKCLECGDNTTYKNLNIGYLKFCSLKCCNRNKAKNPDFLRKLSVSQKGIPKPKHNEATKELCRKIMLDEWKNNREARLQNITREEVRSKISKTVSEKGFCKTIDFIDGIRVESRCERDFLFFCKDKNIQVKRFSIGNSLSIPIEMENNKKRWAVPDFIIDKNVIVDVKDFHHWFIKELNSNLKKYRAIEKWCNVNNFIFKFWFQRLGFITIDLILELYHTIPDKTKTWKLRGDYV